MRFTYSFSRRIWLVIAASCTLAAWLCTTGCPGSINDPERFLLPISQTEQGTGAAGTPDQRIAKHEPIQPDTSHTPEKTPELPPLPAGCEPLVIIDKNCVSCHAGGDSAPPNLKGPDVKQRLQNQTTDCGGTRPYISKDNPLSGVLWEKISQSKPSCGDQMPYGVAPLSPEKQACLKAWIQRP
jgi:hypothetical protein